MTNYTKYYLVKTSQKSTNINPKFIKAVYGMR